MYYGGYGLYFGGGSYSSVYVLPPLFVSPVVLVVYIPIFFYISLHVIFCIPISKDTFSPRFCFFPFVWVLSMIG